MNMRAITELVKNLKIFNQEAGEFLNLIGDAEKDYPQLSGEIKISDFDNGAIANVLEYEMNLAEYLIDQLKLNNASGDFMDFIVEKYYDKMREPSETDASLYQRVYDAVFADKVSPLAIKNAIDEFGDDIEIIEGIGSGAFTEVSFVENINEFDGPPIVKMATLEVQGGNPYFFRVIISNLLPVNYNKIVERINEYKAAGINYIIELREIFSDAVGFTDLCYIEYDDSDLTVSPVITNNFVGT